MPPPAGACEKASVRRLDRSAPTGVNYGFPMAVLAKSKVAKPAASKNPVVVIETTKGTIELELWPSKAPKTVENFLKIARKGD